MIRRPFQPEPPRLIEEDSDVGELLRSVDQASLQHPGVGESEAWQRLMLRQRRRTALSWGVGAAAAIGLLIAAHGLVPRPRSAPEIVATVEPEPAPVVAEPVEPRPTLSAEKLTETAPPVAPRRSSRPPRTLSAALMMPEPPRRHEADCNGWVRNSDLERAVECFRSVSQQTGVEAEVALYKAARLLTEDLKDPARALPLLEEHRQRFPEGAMRGEVAWLRVRSLRDAGRLDEALAAGEELLATPAGRTLSNELHMLRGRIYQDQRGDCARAASEFVALIGYPGPLGDEAELRRAECLEQLGRLEDARAAYAQYLRRSNIGSESKARDRLRALEVGGFRPEGVAP